MRVSTGRRRIFCDAALIRGLGMWLGEGSRAGGSVNGSSPWCSRAILVSLPSGPNEPSALASRSRILVPWRSALALQLNPRSPSTPRGTSWVRDSGVYSCSTGILKWAEGAVSHLGLGIQRAPVGRSSSVPTGWRGYVSPLRSKAALSRSGACRVCGVPSWRPCV
jgi:hypothetical protein